jgi:hypothetical protein
MAAIMLDDIFLPIGLSTSEAVRVTVIYKIGGLVT